MDPYLKDALWGTGVGGATGSALAALLGYPWWRGAVTGSAVGAAAFPLTRYIREKMAARAVSKNQNPGPPEASGDTKAMSPVTDTGTASPGAQSGFPFVLSKTLPAAAETAVNSASLVANSPRARVLAPELTGAAAGKAAQILGKGTALGSLVSKAAPPAAVAYDAATGLAPAVVNDRTGDWSLNVPKNLTDRADNAMAEAGPLSLRNTLIGGYRGLVRGGTGAVLDSQVSALLTAGDWAKALTQLLVNSPYSPAGKVERKVRR